MNIQSKYYCAFKSTHSQHCLNIHIVLYARKGRRLTPPLGAELVEQIPLFGPRHFLETVEQ